MRGRASIAATLAAIACAVAVGCGSDDDGSGAPAGAASTATVAVERTLTAEQYAELERLYRAMVPLDALARDDDPEAARRLGAKTARSCAQVDQRDPLLTAMGSSCRRMADSLVALGALDCTTLAECEALLAKTARMLRDMLAEMRRIEPIVEREVASSACRDVLLAPELTELLAEGADTFDRFLETIDSGDPDAIEGASADLEATSAALDDAPTSRDQLRVFRAACRPAAG